MFVKIRMNILWSAGCSKEMIIRLKKSEQKCIGTTGRITGKTKNAFREINNRKVKSFRKALDFLNFFAEKFLDTAKRELYEETGAVDFDIKPICVYSVAEEGLSGSKEERIPEILTEHLHTGGIF